MGINWGGEEERAFIFKKLNSKNSIFGKYISMQYTED